MSVDDPAAKDSVVLGADLVEALGFEPVGSDGDSAHPGDTDRSVAANGSSAKTEDAPLDELIDDGETDDGSTEAVDSAGADSGEAETTHAESNGAMLSDAMDESAEEATDEGDISLFGSPPVVDRSNGTTPDHDSYDVASDDIDSHSFGDVEDEIATADVEVDPSDSLDEDEDEVDVVTSPSRGRFGVRGLFSRNAESVADEPDLDAPADPDSTAALFAAEATAIPVDEELVDEELVDEELATEGDELLARETADDEWSDADELPEAGGVFDDDVDDDLDDLAVADSDDRYDEDRYDGESQDDDGEWIEDDMNDTTTVPLEDDLYEDDCHDDGDVIDLVADERDDATRREDVVIVDDRFDAEAPLIDDAAVAAGVAGTTTSLRSGSTKLRARKSRRVIRHIDPWSVLVFSIVFHIAFFAALLLAGVLVWNAALAAGTIESIENFIRELADLETFEINSDQVFKAGVVIATMLTLASSVLVVLLTVVFNLISDLIGGIRVTVIEEETVRVRSSSE